MKKFYDAFISYGRAESKVFATKLHDNLTKQGLHIWFDQNDIPLAVDFQEQIDEGISKSHNFIFIIAPHSLQSEYCLKEIELAVKLKKRIIPILHIEPWTKEVWNQMHPTIAKINWIYFREKFEPNVPLEQFKPIDDFEASFEGLLKTLNSHKDYVEKHTELLNLALDWKKRKYSSNLLLVGKERQEAEKWLHQEFKGEQSPCIPTDLQCEYIVEAKKNANNLMTEVFIAYAVEDIETRDFINRSLIRQGISTWIHQKDIKAGIDYATAIYDGIEQADNLLFLISSESIKSEYCLKELAHAQKYNKRIIPILIDEVNYDEIPDGVKQLQFIEYTKLGKEDSIQQLLGELDKDYRYHEQHKVFLAQALKWEKQKRNPSILLRGYNLEQAKTWLKLGKQKMHKPTKLHEEFIAESIAKIGQLHTEVFISYSRTDSDFARKLNEHLQLNGKTTWFDQESIASGADFQQEIYKGIEASDNFVFVLSPDSVKSPYCDDEVEYAMKFNKRFVTVLHRETNPADMHTALAAVQWIDFKGKDFHTAYSELVRTLDTDREYVQNHTKISQEATEWIQQEKDKDLLLRGNEFAVADAWLQDADREKKQPAPTDLQREFIEASRQEIMVQKRKEKRRIAVLTILLIVAVIALVVAVFFMFRAEESRKIAENKEKEARLSEQKALEAEKRAILSADSTRVALKKADSLREIADSTAIEAIKAMKEAKKQRANALEAKKFADLKRIEAEQAEQRAVAAKKATEEANRLAMFHLYVFNAKEFANKSIITQADNAKARDLKAQLALMAYDLKHVADTFPYDKENDPEILEALQNAYLLFESDHLHSGETKALDARNGNIAFSDKLGQVLITETMEQGGTKPPCFKYAGDYKLKTNGFVQTLTFNPDGTEMLYGTDKGYVMHYDIAKKSNMPVFNHNQKSVLDVAFVPKKNWLISSGADRQIQIMNKGNEQTVRILEPQTIARAIEVIDSKYLVTTNENGKIMRWDFTNFSPVEIYKDDFAHPIYSMTYNKSKKWLIAGSTNGKVLLILNPQKNAKTLVFPRKHKGFVSALAFSPDNRWLATASLDGTVMLWDLSSVKNNAIDKLVPITIDNQNRKIFSLTFDEQSKYLIFGDYDRLHIRPLDTDIVYNKLQLIMGKKQLSNPEWHYYKRGDLKRPNF